MFSKLSLALSLPACLVYALALPEQHIFTVDNSVNHQALLRRFTVNGSHDLEQLLQIAQDDDLDVWQITPSHVDIYFPPPTTSVPNSLSTYSHSESIMSIPSTPIQPTLSVDDWNLSSLANSSYHAAYHPLFEIDDFMYEIQNMYPDLARVIPLGHSGQGREMYGLKISRADAQVGSANESTESQTGQIGPMGRREPEGTKQTFVVMGAQHAREWVATAASLYLTHALVADASEGRSLSRLLDNFDFYIIPVPNPDGYDYTWESDRFWYKNRMVINPDTPCIGLDMNRNWGYKWKSKAEEDYPSAFKRKTPADPCSHWYPGRRPFQAPEVNNMANFIMTLPNLNAFVDLRAYGQMLSSPYSYSCKKMPKDAEDQIEAALGAVNALKQVHGTPFMTGSLCSMLYRAPGNVVDWMYKKAAVKYSYAAHLRDTGTYGFALPPQWIRPVGEETANMIEYIANFMIKGRD